jgi:peptide deformylase
MELLQFPHPLLLKKCKPVILFEKELKVLLESMWDLIVKSNGVGLSANQCGLTQRMFVMLGPENKKIFIVNPEIIAKSVSPALIKEGCLSAPGEFLLLTERVFWVKLRYQDENGKFHENVFKDVYSVCIQHEIDHLNGVAFLQSKSLQKSIRQKLAKKWGIK